MTEKIELVKDKLLSISRTGVFSHFTPEQIDSTYKELKSVVLDGDWLAINELYELYELHVYLSLITGHETEAKSYIDRITDQFGDENSQRIKILKSLYFESIGAKGKAADLLSSNTDEISSSKRLISFNKSKPEVYIKNLNFYLDLQPSDLVAWAELADQYSSIGHYDKAIFCYKEVLLQEPHAYNVFYKVGLLNYYLYLQNYNKDTSKKDKLFECMNYLVDARNNWLRTIELCKDHKESWMGIYLLCKLPDFDKKLQKFSSKEVTDYQVNIKKIRDLATKKVVQLNGLKDESELKSFI